MNLQILCPRCVFDDNGKGCFKDCVGFPKKVACVNFISRANNVALLSPPAEKVVPPPPKTVWEIMSVNEPNKCVFYAHLPA